MFVIDTNVASELMRSAPAPMVAAWIAERDAEELFLTAVSEAELLYGVAIMPAGRRRTMLEDSMTRWLDLGFHAGACLGVDPVDEVSRDGSSRSARHEQIRGGRLPAEPKLATGERFQPSVGQLRGTGRPVPSGTMTSFSVAAAERRPRVGPSARRSDPAGLPIEHRASVTETAGKTAGDRPQVAFAQVERILPFDSAAARAYAEIAADRRRAGRPVGEADCQIAAISRARCRPGDA